jgi:hypothetical protein
VRYTRFLFVLALTLSLTSLGQAQTKDNKDKKIRPAVDESDVHRMVIINGKDRIVHYFSKSGSPAEQAALRNLERFENEVAIVDSLQDLKRQYVATESAMEARRRQVQMQLYGRSFETNNSASMGGTNISFGPQSVDAPLVANGGVGIPTTGLSGGFGGSRSSPIPGLPNQINGPSPVGPGPLPGPGYPGAIAAAQKAANAAGIPPGTPPDAAVVGPVARAVVAENSPGFGLGGGFGFPGTGFGGGYGYPPTWGQQPINSETFNLKTDTKITESLANGIGDEGQFKREMVAQMARQATPEYAASAQDAYKNALASFKSTAEGVPVGYSPTKPRRAIVKMKDNEEIKGELVREDPTWTVVRTEDSEVRVRTADVARVKLELVK